VKLFPNNPDDHKRARPSRRERAGSPSVTDFTKFNFQWLCIAALALLLAVTGSADDQQQNSRGELADEPMVDIAKLDPTIMIDLRYASDRNITGHPIYPPGTHCLLRKGVAERLEVAQKYLRSQGYGLKIWDAYRPAQAHQILWNQVKNPEVVADPSKGGSLHSWGVAVDVTLVDLNYGTIAMPSDFDDFTPAAKTIYKGNDPATSRNLQILREAMAKAGFDGIRDEWWHFMAKNWQSYQAITTADPQNAAASPSPSPAPEANVPPATTAATPDFLLRKQ
jgi:D-alanyl-D-alanine dipeptidase